LFCLTHDPVRDYRGASAIGIGRGGQKFIASASHCNVRGANVSFDNPYQFLWHGIARW